MWGIQRTYLRIKPILVRPWSLSNTVPYQLRCVRLMVFLELRFVQPFLGLACTDFNISRWNYHRCSWLVIPNPWSPNNVFMASREISHRRHNFIMYNLSPLWHRKILEKFSHGSVTASYLKCLFFSWNLSQDKWGLNMNPSLSQYDVGSPRVETSLWIYWFDYRCVCRIGSPRVSKGLQGSKMIFTPEISTKHANTYWT